MTDSTQLREQIEQTRSNLSADVNSLADTVKPGNVARRQGEKVRGRVTGVLDTVMGKKDVMADKAAAISGKREDLMARTSDVGSAANATLSSISDSVAHAPAAVREGASGNPLAAGLIALGVGWLAGSLLPSTVREQQAAVAVKQNAVPVVKDAAKDIAENLREPAQDAFASVKDVASDAAATVKQEGSSSAQDLKSSAQDAKETLQDTRH